MEHEPPHVAIQRSHLISKETLPLYAEDCSLLLMKRKVLGHFCWLSCWCYLEIIIVFPFEFLLRCSRKASSTVCSTLGKSRHPVFSVCILSPKCESLWSMWFCPNPDYNRLPPPSLFSWPSLIRPLQSRNSGWVAWWLLHMPLCYRKERDWCCWCSPSEQLLCSFSSNRFLG